MGMEKLDLSHSLERRRTYMGFDDFANYTSGGFWTSVTNGSATVAAGAGSYGLLTISAIDSTDNREVYLRSTNAVFTFQAGRPIQIECRLQYTEGNTNAANVGFGIADSVANGLLVNDGAGPKTSGSFAMIYKVDGSTVWKTGSSVSTTQNLSTSTTTAGGSNYHTLRIDVMPVTSTIAEVTYFVDDIQLALATGRPGQNLIKDQLTYTGAANMQLFVGLKNGSTTAEVVVVDYVAWQYLRGPVYGTTG